MLKCTTKTSYPVPSTAFSPSRKESERVPSDAPWELVLDRRRKKLKPKLARSVVFSLAGFWPSKMLWLRRQPDLRMSVLVSLAKVLKIRPGRFLEEILSEQRKMDAARSTVNRRHASMTRKLVG